MLISFEGGDRCGKTTQIEILKREIEVLNMKVSLLKHPNRQTSSGKIIDMYLKREIELDNEAVTLCLTSNLWGTSECIEEYLNSGYIVLIDRYIHTNLAYSLLRGVKREKLKKMMEGIRRPDVVIYLRAEDVSNRENFGAERYETMEIHEKVINNFDEIFEIEAEENIKILKIESNRSIQQVSDSIWEVIRDLL